MIFFVLKMQISPPGHFPRFKTIAQISMSVKTCQIKFNKEVRICLTHGTRREHEKAIMAREVLFLSQRQSRNQQRRRAKITD
jgi:hypothetical protein